MSEAHSTTNVSYWVDSTSTANRPPLEGRVEVDVAIVGAGIVGLTAARILKRSGQSVAVLEMDRVIHGVTGYTTAKVTSGHGLIYQRIEARHGLDKARAYAAANQGALEQIARWIEEDDIECDFERRSNYVYAESSQQLESIEREVDVAKRAGLAAEYAADIDLLCHRRGSEARQPSPIPPSQVPVSLRR